MESWRIIDRIILCAADYLRLYLSILGPDKHQMKEKVFSCISESFILKGPQ